MNKRIIQTIFLVMVGLFFTSCSSALKVDYKKAISSYNIESLDTFLAKYPESEYSKKIKARRDMLIDMKKREIETAKSLMTILISLRHQMQLP